MASTSRQVTCSFLGPDDPDITVDNARSLEDLKIAIAQQTGRDASLMILLNNVNGVQLTNGVLPAGLSEVTIQLMDLGLLPGMADTDEFRDKLYSFDVPIEKRLKVWKCVLSIREIAKIWNITSTPVSSFADTQTIQWTGRTGTKNVRCHHCHTRNVT